MNCGEGRYNLWKSKLYVHVGNSSVVKIYIIRPKPGPVAKNPRPSGWESNPRPLDYLTSALRYHWAREAVADNLGASSVYIYILHWSSNPEDAGSQPEGLGVAFFTLYIILNHFSRLSRFLSGSTCFQLSNWHDVFLSFLKSLNNWNPKTNLKN